MECPKCHYQNAGEAMVCNLCGEVLSRRPSARSGAGGDSQAEARTRVLPTDAASGSGKLYLHSFVSPPVRVEPDRPVSIGRVAGNDIVLPAKVVSRRHARVEYRDPDFYVVDLGSSNGTFVNDVRVKESAVQSGDEVRVGSFTIFCRDTASSSELSGAMDGGATIMVHLGPEHASGATGFAGKLAEMGVAEICQFLEQNRKSGVLILNIEGVQSSIYLMKGDVVHAETPGLQGREAFFALFGASSGTFRFDGSMPLVKRTIPMPTTSLLLEAARRADEGKR